VTVENKDHTSPINGSTCAICQQESELYQLASFDQIEFRSCKNCESVTSTPIPTTHDITEALKNSIYAKQPVFPHPRERKHFHKHLTAMKGMTSGNKFIDVLSRSGARVELARMSGFSNACGLDLNKYCIEVGQKRFHKARFIETTLEDFTKTEEKFDIICCSHGLENTNNPDTYIKNIKSLMNKNSYLYLNLCDGNHFMIPQSFLNWKEVRYPERVHYISRDGLETLLKRHQLKIIKRYFRFLPFQQVIVKQADA
jgi:hypothetical protein